jgi:hypothetical protein
MYKSNFLQAKIYIYIYIFKRKKDHSEIYSEFKKIYIHELINVEIEKEIFI